MVVERHRLTADELIVCERREDGSSSISAISSDLVKEDGKGTADDCEPAHVEVEEEIKRLYSVMPGTVVAAVPAWELEAWWFLFPSAVGSVRESWREPDHYVGKNVGKIKNAKERLAECIRPADERKNRRFPDYQESDSLRIAERIVAMGLIRKPSGRSESWASFVEQVDLFESDS